MLKRFIALITLTIFLSSCSALLALRESRVDLYNVAPGSSRAAIEADLGHPFAVTNISDKVIASYEYSLLHPDMTRALFHACLDLFSGFAWEFIATPIELWGVPTREKVTVTYKDNIATMIE